MKKLAPLLLCSSALLTACATTSGDCPQPETLTRTEFIQREIDHSLFEDRGVPEVGGLTVADDDQTAAAEQVLQLGASLKEYRCRLNAAGRALIADFPLLAGCPEPTS